MIIHRIRNKKDVIAPAVFLLSSLFASFLWASDVPWVRYERIQGTVRQADPASKVLILDLADGSAARVYVSENAWIHLVRTPDNRSRRRLLRDLFQNSGGRTVCAAGMVYSDKDELVAKEITLFGNAPDDFVFEDPDWWSSQARHLAEFWIKVQFEDLLPLDAKKYRTRITKSGQKYPDSDNIQEVATLSRLVYGLSSAYMMTGDIRMLDAAGALVDYQRRAARYTSPDGRHVYWAHALKNNKRILASLFSDDRDTIPLYEQIYCLAGLTQYFRATGDPAVLTDIQKTIAFMDDLFWDHGPGDEAFQGYFSHISPATFSPADTSDMNKLKKNWNSIGDHLPAYLSNLYLGTRNPNYLKRLEQLGRLISKHFPDKDSPFVLERFYKDFSPDLTYSWQQNRGVVGHNLKIAWCLTRLFHLSGNPEFLQTARDCADKMIRHGEDLRRGGWYDVLERKKDSRTGRYEFTWHDRKAWWQQEQGILANYVLYATTAENKYLDSARRGAAFYNLAFLDLDDGGTYFDVQADGTPFLMGDRSEKGNHSKSGYHSLELAFFAHLYTNLLVKNRQVTLYYRPTPDACGKVFHVQPLSFPKNRVKIKSVTVQGRSHDEFDSVGMSVNLPDSDRTLDVAVTLAPVGR